MPKIKTNSFYEASIDSFLYKIPLDDIDIANLDVLDKQVITQTNARTGEIYNETWRDGKWLEIQKDGYSIGFRVAKKQGIDFAEIKISSKLLEYRYLEGIKMQNIELIYNNIRSCNVFELSFEQFLSKGVLTDIDIKKDVELSREDFKKGIKELVKHSKQSKTKKHGVNSFNTRNNVGIEWNDRSTATASSPFVKIYDKMLESGFKDAQQLRKNETPFFDTYVLAEELKDRVRIEATIKNKATAKRDDMTLQSILSISSSELNQIIVEQLNANLGQRAPKTRRPNDNDIRPQELLNYILLNNLIENQGYDIDTALDYILDHFNDKDKVSKSRTKKSLLDIYSRHIEIQKYARSNSRLKGFFDALGWR